MKLWSEKRSCLPDMNGTASALFSHIGRQTQFIPEDQHVHNGGADQSGFTLVETLAAFAMLAVVLTVVFSGTTQALRSDRRADLSRRALALAQFKLDQFGILEPLIPGERSGTLDGFAWTAVVRPTNSVHNTPPMFWVSVSASASPESSANRLSVMLVTLKQGGQALGQ